jgi:transposase
VELLFRYCNRQSTSKRLLNVRFVALTQHRSMASTRSRQSQTRLSLVQIQALVDGYRTGALIKDLAKRFGVHRTTVTTVLARHGVALRPVSLSDRQVMTAGRLYECGWTLAQLARKYDVDDMTIWRSLKKIGVVMRSPHARQQH